MKRFIDLRDQIDQETKFAWYDTVIDEFENFSGNSTWNSWRDFKEDYDGNDLIRYKRLCPVWVFGD